MGKVSKEKSSVEERERAEPREQRTVVEKIHEVLYIVRKHSQRKGSRYWKRVDSGGLG